MRYIGSKVRILDFIDKVISDTYGDVRNVILADLFAGTASVSEFFKKKGAQIISNDYMCFSYALQIAKIKLNSIPECRIGYEEAIEKLNTLEGENGFFLQEYTREQTVEKDYERNYFSVGNARKIDAICHQLAIWKENGDINDEMFYLLSASLVDAITKVSNTSGTYGAFLKIDDKRMYKKIELEKLTLYDNGLDNECYCEDILSLIKKIRGDILYLDPPYNSRQYPPYYHILETAVLYDDPPIYGLTGRRPYEDKISPFCIKEKALTALENVVNEAQFKHIYISYSTDGIIPYRLLCERLKSYGEVDCFFRDYRRYKSNDGGKSEKPLKEIIVYVKKR